MELRFLDRYYIRASQNGKVTFTSSCLCALEAPTKLPFSLRSQTRGWAYRERYSEYQGDSAMYSKQERRGDDLGQSACCSWTCFLSNAMAIKRLEW